MDATSSPPPLADPFTFGVDCILHSGAKYLAGHSDVTAGVLVVPSSAEWKEVNILFAFQKGECSIDRLMMELLALVR